ncbi:leucine-rich repeat protein, partial [Prevotella sp. P6B4]|uniref:leucine-rich repeat protein n=1 Tax=Prevotella sp. P6B4 TaxID=1410614 RepID=UPI0018CC6B43
MKQNKLILVLTLLMSMVSLNAFADFDTSTKVQVGMLYYYLDKSNHYAQVTSKPNDGKYSGYVPIPASIEYNSINYTVTSIYKNAFKLSDVTTVIIANGVTSIGENAFEYCYKLASVTIPSSVTSIGDYAFEDCRALTSVIIPNGVTSIGEGAFWGCSGLISFTIPNSVTSIGNSAFGGCSGLTSITIPNSVASIGNNILFKCSNLTSIEVESGNAYYDSRDNCNAIIKTAANELIEGCKNTIIPNSVTSIGNMAFWGCSGLSSITIPNSVSSIGVSTFEYCSGLTSITIPNSVMSIGKSAFKGCSELTSITIPNSVTSIGEYAFRECYKLNKVIINDIGAWCNVVFSGSYSNPLEFARHLYSDENTEIADLVIPNGVTTIGNYVFANCEGLTSVTIPNSVTSIGDNAFKGCSGLSSVTALNPSPATITQSVFSNRANATLYVPAGCKTAYELANNWKEFKEIVELTDYNFTFADSNVKAICIEHWDTDGDGLISFDEAAAVTTLSDYFRNKSITLFDELINFTGLTSIDSYAFDGCSGLTSITIPGSVTSIGSSAFNGCSGLTSVTIPNSVTSIGSSAFNSCSGLTSVTVLNPSPVVITGNAFSNRTITTLYVPAGSKAAYEAANYWKDFKEIVEPTITFADSNVKAICVAHWDTNNDGEINFDEAAAVTTLSDIFKENTSITSFDELAYFTGLTSIDDYAFAYCDGLTSVTIPNSVKSIGSYAFDSCDNLTSVTISNGVMSIGEGAFAECYNLNKVIINDIGAWCNVVFSGSGSNPLEKAHHLYSDENTEITDLVIPNGVTTIGNEVFAYCDGLTSVTIPNSVTSIGDYAFYDCCDLNKVIINDVAAWCNIAFSESYSNPLYYAHHLYSDENTEITDLVIPNGVTTIRNEVFANCEGLTSVTIPNSVTSIGDNAF